MRVANDETRPALPLKQAAGKPDSPESRLSISDVLYKTIIQSTLDGFFLSDTAGKIIDVNEAFCHMLGYSRVELLDMTICDFDTEFMAAPDKLGRRIKKLKEVNGFFTIKQHLCKDGHTIDVAISIKYLDTRPGLLFCFHRDVTERRRMIAELQNSHHALRGLHAHTQSAREQERAIMAREIHDELGQRLTSLKIDLSWLGRNLNSRQELLVEKTEAMAELVDSTIQVVRRMASELRPQILDDLGLLAAIEWYAGEFQKRSGIEVRVCSSQQDIVLDKECSIAIFRVLQEALTNVARHAGATRVAVYLEEQGGSLAARIIDNGRGITQEAISNPASFGLIGMRERVHLLGGGLKIRGNRPGGTTIAVSVPLRGEK